MIVERSLSGLSYDRDGADNVDSVVSFAAWGPEPPYPVSLSRSWSFFDNIFVPEPCAVETVHAALLALIVLSRRLSSRPGGRQWGES